MTERICAITTMRNEGPFILEWIAYNRVIGVTDFLVYTNDCADGTEALLDALGPQAGVVRRDNPFRSDPEFARKRIAPQFAALKSAPEEPVVQQADWLMVLDVDEFIDIHAGDGRLADLRAAVPGADMISLTWRLFGNDGQAHFEDAFVTERFTRAARIRAPLPFMALGFKTLFRNAGLIAKLGVHRPKLAAGAAERLHWVNGSGRAMPADYIEGGWKSSSRALGYELATLNHYAVRDCESFLVKRDRGRTNHDSQDQGLGYWVRMNHNAETDTRIRRMLPALRAEHARLCADPAVAAAHRASVDWHRRRIGELRAGPQGAALLREIASAPLDMLSRSQARIDMEFYRWIFRETADVLTRPPARAAMERFEGSDLRLGIEPSQDPDGFRLRLYAPRKRARRSR